MQTLRIVLCCLAALFFADKNLSAQNPPLASYEFRYHHGAVLPHYKAFRHFITGRIPTFELNMKKRLSGDVLWHASKNYPYIGGGLFYSKLQNPDILGSAYGAHFFWDFPIYEGEISTFKIRLSPGLVYLTKKFDMQSNPYNVAIGSHLNALLQANLTADIRLSDKLSFAGGFSLIHFSSGAMRFPNAGINQLALSGGLSYYPQRVEPQKIEIPDFVPESNWLLIASAGIHQYSFENPSLHFAGSLRLEYEYRLSRGSGFNAGANLFYDDAIRNTSTADSITGTLRQDFLYPAFHLGYNFHMGEVCFYFHTGYYIKYRPEENQNIFSRLGLRYVFSERYILSLSLKTYLGKADFVEWGIGCFLTRRSRSFF